MSFWDWFWAAVGLASVAFTLWSVWWVWRWRRTSKVAGVLALVAAYFAGRQHCWPGPWWIHFLVGALLLLAALWSLERNDALREEAGRAKMRAELVKRGLDRFLLGDPPPPYKRRPG